MMDRTPKVIDYIRFTDAKKSLSAKLSFNFCHRLIEVVYHYQSSEASFIDVDLNFGVDDLGHRFLVGTLKTEVTLECQRCMQEMKYPVNISLNIAFVQSSHEEDEISGLYEAYYVEDKSEPIDLHELIEEEVLLSLPLIAKHDNQCVQLHHANTELEDVEQTDDKKNPFAILQTLKK